MTDTTPETRALARQIHRLARETRGQARASQAAYRSVEVTDGPVVYYDDDGNEILSVGQQADGYVALVERATTTPPQPTEPDVLKTSGGLRIVWDGTYEYENTPSNFRRVEVHVSQAGADFECTDATQVGEFNSPTGGDAYWPGVASTTAYWVRLVTVDTSGNESIPSLAGTNYIDPVVNEDPLVPPATSPAIAQVTGMTCTIAVETTNVDQGTEIDYHISTVDGFTPDSTTLYATTPSQVQIIQNMPDGTPFLPGEIYYVRVVAHNVAGTAVGGPSAQMAGQLNLANVDTLITAKLVAGFILTGRIAIGQITIDAAEGITVNRLGGGFALKIPSDGISPIEAVMQIVTDKLNVTDNLSIGGNAQLYGEMEMSNGIDNPGMQPGIGNSSDSLQLNMALFSGQVYNYGIIDYHANTARVVSAGQFLGNCYFRTFSKTTGLWTGDLVDNTTQAWCTRFNPYGGIAYASGYYYIIGQDLDRSSDWYVYKINATTYAKSAEFRIGVLNAWPAVVTDGTTIYMVWSTTGGKIRIRGWNSSLANTLSATDLVTGLSGAFDIGGAVIGNHDGSGSRLYVAYLDSSNTIQAFNTSTWAPDTARNFKRIGSSVYGLGYDSVAGQIIDFDSGAVMHRYGINTTAKTLTGKLAWLDDDITGGTHETMPGPTKTITLAARRYVSTSVDTPPDYLNTDPLNTDKANKVALYLTDDAGATWRRVVYDGSESWGGTYKALTDLSTGTPKVTNEFTSSTLATPGRFRSRAEDALGALIDLKGSGIWRMGNYTSQRHYSRRTRGTDLTVATATATDINFATNIDTEGMTWDSTNFQWVVAKAGVYQCTGHISWQDGNTTGRRTLLLRRYTAGAWETIVAHDLPANAQYVTNHISVPVDCEVGDYIAFQAFQNSGANRAVAGGENQRCFGAITFVGS